MNEERRNSAIGAARTGQAQRAKGVQPAAPQYRRENTNAATRPARTKREIAKLAGIICGVVLVVYLIGALVFSHWFVPNTKLGVFDISLKTSAEVQEMLDSALEDYSLQISGDGFTFTASADDAGLDIDTNATVDAIHQDLNGWLWPVLLFFNVHDETSRLTTTSDSGAVMQHLTQAVNEYNGTAAAPVSANIAYDSSRRKFSVQADSIGTQLDCDAVVDAASTAMAYLQPTLKLDESYLLQPAIKADDPRIKTALEQANAIAKSYISLMFGSVSVGTIDGNTLAEMVTLDADASATLDTEKLNAWVVDFASRANTAGSTRAYTRADGKQISVTGGVYGWEIDANAACSAITEAAKQGAETQLAVPCLSEGAVYTEAGQRDWGARYLDVDISEQHVRFYGDDGNIIWEADCITGSGGERETVQGVWYVTDKESPYTLVGYSGNVAQYESHVTYWMPFEGNAIGFHDATWQPGFGGNLYQEGYGSHGCVNLSFSDAEKLYGLISIRDVVVVHM